MSSALNSGPAKAPMPSEGRFGRAGKLIGEFGTTNSLDCSVPGELLVGETGNWRVQRVRLRPAE